MLSPGPNVAPVRVGRCRVTCWARPSSRLVTGARLASDCWPRLVSDRGQLSGPGLHTPPAPRHHTSPREASGAPGLCRAFGHAGIFTHQLPVCAPGGAGGWTPSPGSQSPAVPEAALSFLE